MWLCSPFSFSRDLPRYCTSQCSVCKRQITNFSERKKDWAALSPCPLPQLIVKSRSPSQLAQDQSSQFPCSGSSPPKPECTPQTGEYPKEQESAGIKTRQWIGHRIKGLEMRERNRDAGATAVKGPSEPGVIPKMLTLITQEAQQPPTPSHSNGFFPKQNAPKGLKKSEKKG